MIRTIELRMVGTKESKEELKALGEDVDDFVVQTESKLRESIMNLTKVASNGYKGFDILDENGNYKSFYDRMLGLAEIYQEIQEQDKALGNNSATALIELIAGKNMSAVAGSILSNPEMLKAAYETAMNAEGSAANELEKKLDSIDSKLAQLKTRGQEFWSVVLDSEFLKNGIQLISNLVDKLTDLEKIVGVFPTLIAGIAGAASVKKNLGIYI